METNQNPKTPKPQNPKRFLKIRFVERYFKIVKFLVVHYLCFPQNCYSLESYVALFMSHFNFHLVLPGLFQILPVYQEDVVSVKLVILCTYFSASSFLRSAKFSTYWV